MEVPVAVEAPNRPGQLYSTVSGHLYHAGKICIVMVGLPGRGKTNRSERITRFLNWLGVRSKTFHLSNYRRALLGPGFKLSAEYIGEDHNEDRARVKKKCFEEMFSFFKDEGGQVAVYDAVNGTASERSRVQQILRAQGVESLFVESLVTNEKVLARNIAEVRLTSPDYVGRDAKESIEHYLRHIESRMSFYEPVREPKLLSIRLVNDGEQCVVNNGPLGYLMNRVLMFLLNSRRRSGSIFFARSGSTEPDDHRNNGDNDLNPRGTMYSATLANTLMGYVSSKQLGLNDIKMDMKFIKRVADHKSQLFASAASSAVPSAIASAIPSAVQSASPSLNPSRVPSASNSCANSRSNSLRGSVNEPDTNDDAPLLVWTSSRRKTIQTSRPFQDAGVPVSHKSLLNQLSGGDAWPYFNYPEKLKELFPTEYEAHLKDPYHHRFPRAESYQDVAIRLQPIIMEMERVETNLLIIGHETVLRVLYGYIMGLSSDDIPGLEFPANEIVEIVQHGYSNLVVRIPLAGVSTDGGVKLPEGIKVEKCQ